MEISSEYLHSQIVRARELKLLKKVYLPHLSCVTCHVSNVAYHVIFLLCFYRLMKLVDGGSVINGANQSSFLKYRMWETTNRVLAEDCHQIVH